MIFVAQDLFFGFFLKPNGVKDFPLIESEGKREDTPSLEIALRYRTPRPPRQQTDHANLYRPQAPFL
jgi:hypothetical protein